MPTTSIKLKRPASESAVAVTNTQKNNLVYGEPGICPNTKKLIIGSGTADNYFEFVAEGLDSNYAAANHNHNLTDLSNVESVIGSQDGYLLYYDHGNQNFNWVAPTSNTDTDVTTGNLVTRLGQLSGTFYLGADTSTTTVIRGDLQVDGNTTTLNTATLEIEDVNITLAKGSNDPANSSTAGITIDGTDANFGAGTEARFYYAHNANFPFGSGTTETFVINRPLQIVGSGGISKLEIVSSAGYDATLTMNKIGTGDTTVITNGAWTGDNLTEGQITGANFSNWDTAYSWGNHAAAGYLTSQISHANVVVDGDFTGNGFLKRISFGNYDTTETIAEADLGLTGGSSTTVLSHDGAGNFAWKDVGTGGSDVAVGNHAHTGTQILQWLDGETLDGGTF